MAWCWPGDKQLSEPVVVNLLTHMCITWPEWVNLSEYVCIFKWIVFVDLQKIERDARDIKDTILYE